MLELLLKLISAASVTLLVTASDRREGVRSACTSLPVAPDAHLPVGPLLRKVVITPQPQRRGAKPGKTEVKPRGDS